MSCAIDRNSRDEAMLAMTEQLEQIKQGNFTDGELQAAKKLLISSYTQLEDSTRAISSFYQLRRILGLQQTPLDCRDAFMSVRAEQVISAAATLQADTVYFLCGTMVEEQGGNGEFFEGSEEIANE